MTKVACVIFKLLTVQITPSKHSSATSAPQRQHVVLLCDVFLKLSGNQVHTKPPRQANKRAAVRLGHVSPTPCGHQQPPPPAPPLPSRRPARRAHRGWAVHFPGRSLSADRACLVSPPRGRRPLDAYLRPPADLSPASGHSYAYGVSAKHLQSQQQEGMCVSVRLKVRRGGGGGL